MLASKWRTTTSTRSKRYAHRMAGRSHRSRWNQRDLCGTTAHTTSTATTTTIHSGVFRGVMACWGRVGCAFQAADAAPTCSLCMSTSISSSEHWKPLQHEDEYHHGCGGHRQNRRIAWVNSHQWSTAPPYADVKREASVALAENSYAHR